MTCDCCGRTASDPSEIVADQFVFEPEYGSTVCGECVSALLSVSAHPAMDDDVRASQGGQT